MYTNHPYIAQQIAHQYTRDRIREAETYRAAKNARVRTRVRRVRQPGIGWFAAGRTTIA